MKRFLIPAVCATTLLILTACAAPITAVPTAIPSNTPPPTSTSTTTPTPTVAPTSTSTPTHTPLPPTLEPAIWDLENNDYLDSDPAFPDCELPCWQGLKVGESTQDDVQMTLTSLVTDAESIFSAYYKGQSENTYLQLSYEFYFEDDLDLQTYDWESQNDSFEIGTVIDRQDTLQALFFHLSNDDDELPHNYHTAQHVLNRFGEPAGIYFFAIEAVRVGIIGRLLMVYEEGMSFFWVYEIYEGYDENATEHIIQFCLDDMPSFEEIMIFSRQNSRLDNLRETIITEDILSSNLVDVEENNVFGLTISDISILARTEEKVCLRLGGNE